MIPARLKNNKRNVHVNFQINLMDDHSYVKAFIFLISDSQSSYYFLCITLRRFNFPNALYMYLQFLLNQFELFDSSHDLINVKISFDIGLLYISFMFLEN